MTKEEIIDKSLSPAQKYGCQHIGHDQIEAMMDEYAKYWEKRCLAAEDFIKKSPCDPDTNEDQVRAWLKWQQFIEHQQSQQSK